MVLAPRIKNNVCVTAHPEGCAAQVARQVALARAAPLTGRRPRLALVVGASNGYGLAARIVAAFSAGAATVGVSLETPARGRRTATAGWYNSAAFDATARQAQLPAVSINGDAFTAQTKQQCLDAIRLLGREVDLLVYSIAAPRRLDPATGELHTSAIKPLGQPYEGVSLGIADGRLSPVVAEPASAQEVRHTIKVMGGEDWQLWVEALAQAGLLAPDAFTVAFSYIGPPMTAPIYRSGTLGQAKQHLEQTAQELQQRHSRRGLQAVVSVNKALLTRASAVIPGVSLYLALLQTVLRQRRRDEGCIEQMLRLFHDHLYSAQPLPRDAQGRIRLDDRELDRDVQAEVRELWQRVLEQGVLQQGPDSAVDLEGFRRLFLQHHGFEMPEVDYSREVEL